MKNAFVSKLVLLSISFQLVLSPNLARADDEQDNEHIFQLSVVACNKLSPDAQPACLKKAQDDKRNAEMKDVGKYALIGVAVLAGIAVLNKIGGVAAAPMKVLKKAAGIDSGSGPQASLSKDKGTSDPAKGGESEQPGSTEKSVTSSTQVAS